MLRWLKNLISRDAFWGWVFILPALLGTIIFIILPVVGSLSLSFMKWNLLGTPSFVGFDNYAELLKDKEFYYVLLNTFIFALTTMFLGVVIPLLLAYIIDKKIKAANFFKTAYFLPFITPMIVVAIVWEWIFDPTHGLLNWIFHSNVSWLYDTHFAMIALIIVSVWKNIGYNMIIFLAGLQGISPSFQEAAKIDGASETNTFLKIILPILSPTVFFVVIITTISSFQVFDLVYLMTQGGPQGSTNIIVYWMYKTAFEFFNVGKASAIAYILFFIILVLTAVQWKLRKKWVINE